MASIQSRTRPTKPRTEQNDDLQKWTAARCNRLLRQISSRVTHLRQLVTEAAEVNRPPKRPTVSHDEQPETKRVRRTYGGRSKKKPAPLSDRDINISTPPRIMRALGTMRPHMVSSPVGLCCPTPVRCQKFDGAKTNPFDNKILQSENLESRMPSQNPSAFSTRLSQLSDGVSPDHLKIYQAILGWLEKLIQVTDEKHNQSGPKSLLEMCLRKVPDCLDEIDAWDHKEAESVGQNSMWKGYDAAATIYGQLEAFGSLEEGWKPFKHLVRSHAIQILSHAATEGLFAPEFVVIMAKSCARMQCTEEAERLLSSCRGMANSDHWQAPDKATSSSVHETCNRAVLEICVGDGPMTSFLPIVGNAMSNQQLLLGDMLPKHLSTLWKTSLAAVHEASATINQGTRLLIPALKALASSDDNGPWSNQAEKETMLTSLAAAVAAAAMTSQSQQVKRRHIFILEAAMSEVTSKRGRSLKAQHCGLFVLTMARQLAIEEDKSLFVQLRAQGVKDLDSLVSRSKVQALYRQTVALTCSIAHACSRSVARPSHEILDQLRLALHELPLPIWFIEGIRSEGAFVLAQKTKDLRDLAFAENLSETHHQGTSRASTTTMFSGWRWEAGISEWVLPSPPGKAVAIETSPATTQCEFDSIGSERQVKRQMRKGFMPKGLHAKPQPCGIDTHNATNRNGESGVLQSKIQAAKPTTNTLEATPRRKSLLIVRSCEALGPARQGHVSCTRMKNKLCKDVIGGVDENDDKRPGIIARTNRPTVEDEETASEEPRRPSGSRTMAGTKASSRNGDSVQNGAQGLGIMREGAVTATASKVVRRKSTTAVSCVRRRLSADSVRGQRRRTTVSLSSLATWPGSDDWNELL